MSDKTFCSVIKRLSAIAPMMIVGVIMSIPTFKVNTYVAIKAMICTDQIQVLKIALYDRIKNDFSVNVLQAK